ncbi:hypothetical protein BDQ17DRAFT_1346611 [Cyathus striatus]|nr:hypothetical protein BDQ17DRAFT_1346611 [Cyathus striatus]
MDVIISIAAGLGLRALLVNLGQIHGNVSPALIVVDLLLTRDLTRLVMVVLWSSLGALVSESITVPPPTQTKSHKKHRHSPNHYHIVAPQSTPLSLPAQPPLPPIITSDPERTPEFVTPPSPPFNPSRPPSPPSFFLQGESGSNSPASPQPLHMMLFPHTSQSSPPLRPPSALASYLEADEADEAGSRPPNLPPLPTPPETAIPDRDSFTEDIPKRLSTINELSSEEERASPESQPTPTPSPTQEPTYAASIVAAPVSISSRLRPRADTMTSLYAPSAVSAISTAAPIPIPMPIQRPMSPDDPLTTPGKEHLLLSDTENEGDPLMTPLALRRRELSPLILEQEQPLVQLVVREPHPPSQAMIFDSASQETLIAPANGTEYPEDAALAAAASEMVDISSPASEHSVLSTHVSTKLWEKAQALRDQAFAQRDERVKLESLHKAAVKEGRTRDAMLLRFQIQDAQTEMKKLHAKARRRYFEARNMNRGPYTIDLHGLLVEEAIEETDKALRRVLLEGKTDLSVITGKGLHSQDGIPRIKQELQKRMRKDNITCHVHSKNTGLLIISVPPPS